MAKRRGLQKQVAEALLPLGFIQRSGVNFTRQVGKQLHFVGLQYRRSSSDITFNLGCHFVGVASLFDFREVTVADLDLLDCGMRTRVGDHINKGDFDVWWDPDQAQVPVVLEQATTAIGSAFDGFVELWGKDGLTLLKKHIKVNGSSILLSPRLRHWMKVQAKFDQYCFLALLCRVHRLDALADMFYVKACNNAKFSVDINKLATIMMGK